MRSRYSAYVKQLPQYLLDTWHPRTRPATMTFDDDAIRTRWLGLKILKANTTDDAHATVEFVARCKTGGGAAQRLHEVSRFSCENGRWMYIDGDVR